MGERKHTSKTLALLGGTCLWASMSPLAHAQETDFKAMIEPEVRYFLEKPSDPDQFESGLSIAGEATFELFWDRGDHNIVITPFVRLDPNDGQRNHWDIREFRYEGVFDAFELRIGLDKVFWGVTEFAHIVDIINQTDNVESIDGEEKLGQPMLNLAFPTDLGTINLFALPSFRERTFAAKKGRPRFDIPVDGERSIYEHEDGDQHIDYAVRWSHVIGNFDVGLSWFKGTGRDPLFTFDALAPGGPVLIPTYVQIEQSSIDIQATFDAWLLKFEGLTREELGATYELAAGGFEYSFYGIGDGPSDLGIVAEYVYDSRESLSPQPLNNDIFLGFRLAMNDENSTAILAGFGRDLDTDELSLRLEAERRLGSNYFLTIEAQIFTDIPTTSPLASFEDDDYVQVRLAYYF